MPIHHLSEANLYMVCGIGRTVLYYLPVQQSTTPRINNTHGPFAFSLDSTIDDYFEEKQKVKQFIPNWCRIYQSRRIN